MIRFFVQPNNIKGNSIKLSREDCEHIRSLRLRPDEFFIVCDENGNDYLCKLSPSSNGQSYNSHGVAQIIDKRDSQGEPSVKCTVYMAYSKGDRLDYAVQKSVELGAHEIILFESKRCVAVPSNIPKKIERFQRISLETAKQAGRGIVPKVSDGGRFSDIINDTRGTQEGQVPCVLFYEDENNLHLKTILEQLPPEISTFSIITGPEGGFETSEIECAITRGIPVVSLGTRILRSETAPVVALSAIMYHTGNL